MIAGFLSFATDKTGRWIVGAGIFLLIVWAWLMDQRRMLLKAERMRQAHAAMEKDQAIRKQSNEAVEAADTIRANTERVSSPELRDEHPGDYHYRD